MVQKVVYLTLVAKLILDISPLNSFMLALRGALVISGILSSIFLVLALYAFF